MHDRTFYTQYLKSQRWLAKRELLFAKTGKWCKACGTSYGPLQAHHLTYERLGNERLSDLMVLCTDCHRKVEKLYRTTGSRDRRLTTLAFIKQRKRVATLAKKGLQ